MDLIYIQNDSKLKMSISNKFKKCDTFVYASNLTAVIKLSKPDIPYFKMNCNPAKITQNNKQTSL